MSALVQFWRHLGDIDGRKTRMTRRRQGQIESRQVMRKTSRNLMEEYIEKRKEKDIAWERT